MPMFLDSIWIDHRAIRVVSLFLFWSSFFAPLAILCEVTAAMGACCPKPKRSASDAGSEDNAPLMSAQNGITGNKGRPLSCTPSEPESKDTDERAVYNQIIDETQGQVSYELIQVSLTYWNF